jgi:hypothetical protein
MNDDSALPSRALRTVRTARRGAALARRWLRAFRRSRPFWGAVWLVFGGWTVLKFSLGSVQFVVSHGFNGIAGWLIGGGMMLCGLIPVIAPGQRYTFGVIGAILSIAALIAANLGGFLVGTFCGVLGSAMIFGWGPKRPRRRDRRRAAAAGEAAEAVPATV